MDRAGLTSVLGNSLLFASEACSVFIVILNYEVILLRSAVFINSTIVFRISS